MATTFKFEHDFPNISLEKFIAHLNDPALNLMLERDLHFEERKMIKRKEKPGVIEWTIQVKKAGELPSVLRKIVKDTVFAWREVSYLVQKENCVYWQILPEE